jgi:TonB family protein
MRLHCAIALLLFTAATVLGSPSSACAQDQTSSGRKVTNRIVPAYPELARRTNLRGTVKVEAIVAPNGTLKSAHVVGGNPVLTKAAVDAIGKWKWTPAPQESKELIQLNFHPD